MGPWAVAHGSQLGRGGACTFLIPQRMHELVTQTLVWFSSGRACVKPKIVQNIPVGQNGNIFQYDSWYNKTRCLIAFKFSLKNLHSAQDVLQMVWLSSSRTSLQKCANYACFINIFFSLQIMYHDTIITYDSHSVYNSKLREALQNPSGGFRPLGGYHHHPLTDDHCPKTAQYRHFSPQKQCV